MIAPAVDDAAGAFSYFGPLFHRVVGFSKPRMNEGRGEYLWDLELVGFSKAQRSPVSLDDSFSRYHEPAHVAGARTRIDTRLVMRRGSVGAVPDRTSGCGGVWNNTVPSLRAERSGSITRKNASMNSDSFRRWM